MHQTQTQQKGDALSHIGYARPILVRLGTLRQITLGRGEPGELLGFTGRRGRGHGRYDRGAFTQSGTRGS